MMYHSANYLEPLLNEFKGKTKKPYTPLKDIPKTLQWKKPLSLPNLDESQVVRHFLHLSQMNYGIDTGIYPLGSCTMKYNPKISEEISKWDCFTMVHPCQHASTVQGNLQIMYELEQMLCGITGMKSFTLQPAAGAHGEFTGLLLTRAYHEANHDFKRDEIILPDTAHGTNPASATMAGYNIIETPMTSKGTVDLVMLEQTLSEKTACFMLTNPNTLGIFESDIQKISQMVHQAGALLYYDGANINAIIGKTRPDDMGFDIVHLNLHKTFSTPHGGGGPGAGPVGVNAKLDRFLPVPRIIRKKKDYSFSYDYPDSIGKIKEFYGNFSVLLKAYIYILIMGRDGLLETSEIAVLNANYMKKKLLDSQKYQMPFRDLRKHEFVISCQQLTEQKGVRALDVAKRLLDYGFHPPTIYFPLIVKEAMMIEPTESETQETLDAYVEALVKIADEPAETVKEAPQNTSVGRVNEVEASKKLILTWNQNIDQSQ
jgi:glycine dehydrogenase subunit 2